MLSVSLALLAALGEAEVFPQDQAGIEALIARRPRDPDRRTSSAAYEDPDALPSYAGHTSIWVGPAGDGRLRLRRKKWAADLASEVFVLGPDGDLEGPEAIDGYGVPDEDLPPSARAELAAIERQRQVAREMGRRQRERPTWFGVSHLRGIVPGPPGQDPAGVVISYLALYEKGLVVNYLAPRPPEEDLDPDDPFAISRSVPDLMLDDGFGTVFVRHHDRLEDDRPVLRGRSEFSPAPAAGASTLVLRAGPATVRIELGAA